MKAGAQEIIRIQIDDESVQKLAAGETLHFPLNDEYTKLVELEAADSEDTDEGDATDDVRGIAWREQ